MIELGNVHSWYRTAVWRKWWDNSVIRNWIRLRIRWVGIKELVASGFYWKSQECRKYSHCADLLIWRSRNTLAINTRPSSCLTRSERNVFSQNLWLAQTNYLKSRSLYCYSLVIFARIYNQHRISTWILGHSVAPRWSSIAISAIDHSKFLFHEVASKTQSRMSSTKRIISVPVG